MQPKNEPSTLFDHDDAEPTKAAVGPFDARDACPRCGSDDWSEITYGGCSECRPDTVGARWAAGIARVEVRHDRAGRNRAFLRLTIAEAAKLRDDLDDVLVERAGDDV